MKKILLVSAVALGLSSVALANGGMAAAPIATAAVTSDFTPGIVVGIQGGYADSGFKALDISGTDEFKVDKDTGLAGRIFVGYDFHKYFAIEAGYFLFGPKTEFKFNDVKAFDVRTQAFDLVGKLKAPIMDNFGLYAKAGVGYLMQKYSASSDLRDTLNQLGVNASDDNVNKFDLVYGFGAYYNFAENWTVDAAFTRYNSGHTKMDKDWQPVVDFYSLGISYKFNLPV